MELRRLSICLAFFVLAFASQCSEARHAVQRRATDYDANDEMLNDESNDYGAQNDADGGNEDEEEPEIHGMILSKGDNYRLLIGKSVRLECKVSPANGTVVEWTKDGEKLFIGKTKVKQSDRFSLVDSSSDILIKDLELGDTGRYTCKILQSNPASITHVIIVAEPPRITRFQATDNGNVREGNDLLLTCDVTGTPKPSVIWSRQKQFGLDGTEPLGESNGDFSYNTFFMRNVTKDDSGTYYCYAISDAGNATAMLTVSVTGKPRVHVHRPVVNTDINVQAELQCSAAHEQIAPHIRWYKDGKLIEDSSVQYIIRTDGSQSTLTVSPAKDEDFGTFTCEAENSHGRHNKSIDLVQSPVIENLDVDGPKLTWTVHSHQPLEDIEVELRELSGDGEWKTFKVPLPETKEGAHQYELIYVLDEKALDAGSYQATVKVKNNKSWSQHSDPAVVQLESQAQPIQTASVFRGSGDGNGAMIHRPTTAIISTILMYLLVRML